MDELAKLTAAGGQLTLGGKTYCATQLKVAEIATFRQWVADEVARLPSPIDLVVPHLGKLPADQAARMLDRAYEDAKRRQDLASPEARAIMEGTDAIALMVYLSIRRHHPDMTLEVVRAIVADEDLNAIQETLTRINDLVDPPAGNSRGQAPKGKAKAR